MKSRENVFGWVGAVRWGMVGAVLGLAGCLSMEQMAPPVDGAFVAAAQLGEGEIASLTRGRGVYLGKCIACHAPEPIGDYSRAMWEKILPEMSIETNLSPQETADLAAYVYASLNVIEANERAEAAKTTPTTK